jgi:hypothetical protein
VLLVLGSSLKVMSGHRFVLRAAKLGTPGGDRQPGRDPRRPARGAQARAAARRGADVARRRVVPVGVAGSLRPAPDGDVAITSPQRQAPLPIMGFARRPRAAGVPPLP